MRSIEPGRNENIRQNWLNIAGDATLSVRKAYNVAAPSNARGQGSPSPREFCPILARIVVSPWPEDFEVKFNGLLDCICNLLPKGLVFPADR